MSNISAERASGMALVTRLFVFVLVIPAASLPFGCGVENEGEVDNIVESHSQGLLRKKTRSCKAWILTAALTPSGRAEKVIEYSAIGSSRKKTVFFARRSARRRIVKCWKAWAVSHPTSRPSELPDVCGGIRFQDLNGADIDPTMKETVLQSVDPTSTRSHIEYWTRFKANNSENPGQGCAYSATESGTLSL